jgi:hypothetical protein
VDIRWGSAMVIPTKISPKDTGPVQPFKLWTISMAKAVQVY